MPLPLSAFRITASCSLCLALTFGTPLDRAPLLVVASIALGVATLVATQALSQSTEPGGAGRPSTRSPSVADLLVVNGQTGVPRERRRQAQGGAALPERRASVQPLRHRPRRPARPATTARSCCSASTARPRRPRKRATRWGIDRRPGTTARPTCGAGPGAGGKPVLVGSELAGAGRRPTADVEFRVRAAGARAARSRVLGTVDVERGGRRRWAATSSSCDLADAAELVFPEKPDHVTPDQRHACSRAPTGEAVRQRVAGSASATAPRCGRAEANDQSVRDVTAGLELGFAIGGAVALVVGLFLVYNALSVSVAERRHDIGILRSLGATRGQVAGLFVGEAAVPGPGRLPARPAAGPGAGLAWRWGRLAAS